MVRAARRGNGSGPEVPMSGKEHSSASAEAKEANISEGSLGGGPSRKPIPLWATWRPTLFSKWLARLACLRNFAKVRLKHPKVRL